MRKILISILIILLIILAYFAIFEGISLGNFRILGTGDIIRLNDELTLKIEEANTKIKRDLQNEKQELSASVEQLATAKEAYYQLANVSTESEISEASTEEIYDIEYLFLRLGRHARQEGVIMRMDIYSANTADPNAKDIAFTITGKYVGIMDFISAIEDDSELAFRIENFNLLPDGENLQATFSVTGIRIRLENTTQTVNGTTTDTNTGADQNTTGTTATENTNTVS